MELGAYRIHDTSPLEREEQADDHADTDNGANPVERQPFLHGSLAFVECDRWRRVARLEQERHGEGLETRVSF